MEQRFFFFAGGDHVEGEGNPFTANFIRYLTEILEDKYSLIEGIYHPAPVLNVIWALNHAQQPARYPSQNRTIASSLAQVLDCPDSHASKITFVSSSYGSVVAAQVACQLAEYHRANGFLSQPVDLALGASMVSVKSSLYQKLLEYQREGIIGKILLRELHDEGDNSNELGGRSRLEAYTNGLGICFPFLTTKFSGPSFLNKNPKTGHLHRVRAHSIDKAIDFIRIIFIENGFGGETYYLKANELLVRESLK